jgi:hypothetical protein
LNTRKDQQCAADQDAVATDECMVGDRLIVDEGPIRATEVRQDIAAIGRTDFNVTTGYFIVMKLDRVRAIATNGDGVLTQLESPSLVTTLNDKQRSHDGDSRRGGRDIRNKTRPITNDYRTSSRSIVRSSGP